MQDDSRQNRNHHQLLISNSGSQIMLGYLSLSASLSLATEDDVYYAETFCIYMKFGAHKDVIVWSIYTIILWRIFSFMYSLLNSCDIWSDLITTFAGGNFGTSRKTPADYFEIAWKILMPEFRDAFDTSSMKWLEFGSHIKHCKKFAIMISAKRLIDWGMRQTGWQNIYCVLCDLIRKRNVICSSTIHSLEIKPNCSHTLFKAC